MSQLVSIIIPTYNRVNIISETLNSVLAQTYENWECIVIDDGSIDTTEKLLNEYIKGDKRFKFFRRPKEKSKGPSSSRNFGIENARGHFILFLDSDDLLSFDCLSNRLDFASNNLKYDFFIFKTELFNKKIGDLNKIFNSELELYSDENYLNLFLGGSYPFCVSSVLWKTDSIKSLGGFDEKIDVLEDPELHIRAFKNNLKSITSNNLGSDNFYRKDVDKINNEENHSKLLKTTYYLLSLYLKHYPKQMRDYALNFYRIEVLLKTNLSYTCKFYALFLFSGILNFKQKSIIPILIFYKILNIEKAKGLGFYRLAKKYIKQDNALV
ncbi:glycosyltransferase family 2 protein [Flavobacterium hydatis]|uniref:Glycosyltransferase 2-like domain-containing protein n=1 Tax=Flavobacterium hydatis TaxID=991 RepID=A0ABX4CLE9_FLAHY|nr:glycosyltransferase family 2 protein [Flavobacterium hydatis]OXA96995.1 hypothetical protein B0A62_07025 [Flavobacterium hydatis]